MYTIFHNGHLICAFPCLDQAIEECDHRTHIYQANHYIKLGDLVVYRADYSR